MARRDDEGRGGESLAAPLAEFLEEGAELRLVETGAEEDPADIAGMPSLELPEGRPVLTTAELAARLDREGRVHVAGASGSAAALAARAACRTSPVVLVAADAEAARAVAQDLAFMTGSDGRPPVLLYLPNEASPYAELSPDRRAAHLRLAVLHHLASGLPFSALVLPIAALSRKVVPKREILEASTRLAPGEEIDLGGLTARLAEAGYVRSPLVEDPGAFARRGALLDVWPPNAPRPARIELYGDLVLSIRAFDPDDQKTLAELPEILLAPAREGLLSPGRLEQARARARALCDAVDLPSSRARALSEDIASGRSFFGAEGFLPAFSDLAPLASYLPEGAAFLVEDPAAATRALREELERAEQGEAEKRAARAPHFPRSAFYDDEEAVTSLLEGRRLALLHRTATAGSEGARGLERLETAGEETPTLATHDQGDLVRAIRGARAARGRLGALGPLVGRIRAWQEAGLRVVVAARAETQAERLVTLLRHQDLEARAVLGDPSRPFGGARLEPGEGAVQVVVGPLARGIVAPAERLALVTEEEIFGARAHRRAARGASKGTARPFLEDLRSLDVGDLVVHAEHGIGRYRGLVHKAALGATIDLVAIEYAGGDKLYLPVYRLNQIQKFRGGEGAPKLDRLGGQTFAKTRARVEKSVKKLADDLLRLYAERRAAYRDPFPAPDDDYRAFEATFPFDETPDQARAIAEVSADLESSRPMDRLVCGDVGFGKTEVAIRAAYRVAEAGFQVAVLCPTTVLAQQHYLNFKSRFSQSPIEVRVLSRFQSKAEQETVSRGLRDGKVDVVIGTHRLLSKDVRFKKLGLLVVDEEQRFGVTHKERIKQLKTNVDVLTLTATPIPRTLQMSVTGLRDMSVITTPPADRRAIRTIVTRPDDAVVREAVLRELGRGGQVFYVYNRVEGLHERAAKLAELVPQARIAVAHGQMSEAALEQAMFDFVEGRFDVLCATAIIESGLDIPRANTMIVDRADMFGLSQLYQLRGRVGRSKERAYCYLVVPPASAMTDEARSRIEALERYTELGSGFQVASLDLELRGSGDLLGAEQSGSVASVGFDLFCQMLDEAAAELRGEVVVHEVDPELAFDVGALLPEDYVGDVGVRLSLYKRLASASSEGEVADLAAEMEDRFGPPPAEAKEFVHLMRLKVELRALRALACEASAKGATLHLREDTPLDPQKILRLVQAKGSPYRLSPDMRLSRRPREGERFASGLDLVDKMLSELPACMKDGA